MSKRAHKTCNYEPLLISNSCLDDPGSLKKRFDDDGYLYFRSLIDTDSVVAMRTKILELCRKEDWLDKTQPVLDGKVKRGIKLYEDHHPEYCTVIKAITKLDCYSHPPFDSIVKSIAMKILGGKVVGFKKIPRIKVPGSLRSTTPPHQDLFYTPKAENAITVWIPLGAIPRELGGLAISLNSHKHGLLKHTNKVGDGGYGIESSSDHHIWATSDYELGDVLFFHNLLLHKSLHNLSVDQLRISFDLRYMLKPNIWIRACGRLSALTRHLRLKKIISRIREQKRVQKG